MVEFAVVFNPKGNPSATKSCVGLGYNWKTTVPDAGMMSQIVAHDNSTLYPTFKNDVLGKVKLTGNALLDGIVLEIAKQLC